MCDRSAAGVTLAIAVYLVLTTVDVAVRRWSPAPMPVGVQAQAAALRETLDPGEMNARQLRRLPGVGWVRSMAIVEAREEYAGVPPLRWEDLPGIGPITTRRIEDWLLAHGVDPTLPLCRGLAGPETVEGHPD